MNFLLRIAVIALIVLWSMPADAQTEEELVITSRKFFTHAYFEQSDLRFKSQMRRYIKPEKIEVPEGFEKASSIRLYFPYVENMERSILENKVVNEIFLELFTNNGGWTYEKILERAKKSLTDSDYQRFKASASGVRAGTGRKFYQSVLASNYLVAFTISDIHTQEEEYNRIDDKRKKDKQPLLSTEERNRIGYLANISTHLYKIIMDDEEINRFELWVFGEDGENTDQQKIAALQSFDFKIKMVISRPSTLTSTVEKKKKKKSTPMSYYLSNLVHPDNFKYRYQYFLQLPEFSFKTVIFDTDKDVLIKIGKKENIRKNQRFLVYETREDAEGRLFDKRMGVIRVKGKPVDNIKNNLGNTPPSKFYQVQGKKLGKGMIVEPNKGGLGSIGYAYFPYSGSNFDLTFYSPFRTAGQFSFGYAYSKDRERIDTTLEVGVLYWELTQNHHFARNYYIGYGLGIFSEGYSFADTTLQNEFVPTGMEEGAQSYPTALYSVSLTAHAGVYLSPYLKLFTRFRYLPGKFKKESPFSEEGPVPVDRHPFKFYVGIGYGF